MRKWLIGSIMVVAVGLGAALWFGSSFLQPPLATVSESSTPTLTRPGETGEVKVVSATNVWSSVAKIIGGEWVSTTAIIQDSLQDPHSYEASARDQLAIKEADLVIANGGGYDDFLNQLDSSTQGSRLFLTIYDQESLEHSDEAGHDHSNEHLWYDIEETRHAAEKIAAAIIELRPEAKSNVDANLAFFLSELDNLELRLEALRERSLGAGVLSLEGVGNLLLDHAGFENLTPEELADAIEEDREVPPAALKRAEDLISGKVVQLLVTNQQQLDVVSEQLERAAAESSIPVVRFSEIIPSEDQDYLDWMNQVIDQLMEAIY